MGWLARREHSCAEVVAKLVRKGCDARIAAQVAAELTAKNFLSDERLAEVVVRSRRRRGYGPMRIRRELQQKGLTDEAVERWSDPKSKDWLTELERVRLKKFGSRPPDNYAERAKQARFLQQRGFTYEQIQQALQGLAAD